MLENMCGIKDAKNTPYLFFNLKDLRGLTTRTSAIVIQNSYCVKKCPGNVEFKFGEKDCTINASSKKSIRE